MDIFGVGPLELIVILIVALLVFGPDRLPTIGAKLGHAMRDMRRATRSISEEISSTRAAIEGSAQEVTKPLQDVTDTAKAISTAAAAVQNPAHAIRDSVLKELNALREETSPQGSTPESKEAGIAAASDAEERRIAPPALPPPLVGEGAQSDAPAPAADPPVSGESEGETEAPPVGDAPDPAPAAPDATPPAAEA